MKVAIVGNGSVARALLPLLENDGRFVVAGIHSRSQPAAASFEQFLDASGADALVELTTLNPFTGEPAIRHVQAAFERDMHVVTANKGPIAHAYHALAAESAARGRLFRFESAVMDGAPVFNLFRNCMPGIRVLGITGVLNSTSNLVIEAMEQGGSLEDGLARARDLGVAEADASYDLEGWDSAVKIAALANVLMDARVTPLAVEREGIAGFDPERIRTLARENKTVRLVCRARRENGALRLSVRPENLASTDVLATGRGTSNVMLFETNLMGAFGIVSLKPQVEQTAYGVYADLVDILQRGGPAGDQNDNLRM